MFSKNVGLAWRLRLYLEGFVKRLPRWPWWLLVITLSLALAACERPLQEDVPTLPAQNLTPQPLPGTNLTPLPGLTPSGEIPLPGQTPLVITPTTDPLAPLPSATPAIATESVPPTAPAAATPRTEEVTYVVVAGDTLGNIASRYGVSVEEIAARNNLASSHVLAEGQQLIIPVPGSTAGTGTGTTTGETVHIVQAGENLYRIGLLYGFTGRAGGLQQHRQPGRHRRWPGDPHPGALGRKSSAQKAKGRPLGGLSA
jgi:LysM repeat protein